MSYGQRYNLNQRLAYLEAAIATMLPVPPLSNVLAVGNNAGASDINMNGNDIQNVVEADFDNGVGTASLQFDPLAPANFEIVCSGDLELRPVGSIDCNGLTIDMTNGKIINCDDLESPNNVDLDVICRGTADFVVTTGGTERLRINDTGVFSFNGGLGYTSSTGVMNFPTPPTCSISATSINQLVNFNNFVDTAYTPILRGQTTVGNPVYVTQLGRYIRINNLCIVQVDIELSSLGTTPPAGPLEVTLPFQCNATTPGSLAIGNIENMVTTTDMVEFLIGIAQNLSFCSPGYRNLPTSGSTTNLTGALITNTFKIRFGGAYICQ